MIHRTQISGKYHLADARIFAVKANLQQLGVVVSHPMGDKFVGELNGVAVAFDPIRKSFADIETDFYERIRTSTFHTLFNAFGDRDGYVGVSAARETLYAMASRRRIVCSHPLQVAAHVDQWMTDLLNKNSSAFVQHNLVADVESLASVIDELGRGKVGDDDFDISDQDKKRIERSVEAFLAGLRQESCKLGDHQQGSLPLR